MGNLKIVFFLRAYHGVSSNYLQKYLVLSFIAIKLEGCKIKQLMKQKLAWRSRDYSEVNLT